MSNTIAVHIMTKAVSPAFNIKSLLPRSRFQSDHINVGERFSPRAFNSRTASELPYRQIPHSGENPDVFLKERISGKAHKMGQFIDCAKANGVIFPLMDQP
jgi:hypothetical protein